MGAALAVITACVGFTEARAEYELCDAVIYNEAAKDNQGKIFVIDKGSGKTWILASMTDDSDAQHPRTVYAWQKIEKDINEEIKKAAAKKEKK